MTREFSIEALFQNPPSSGQHQDGAILTIYKDGKAVRKVSLNEAESAFAVSPPYSVRIEHGKNNSQANLIVSIQDEDK